MYIHITALYCGRAGDGLSVDTVLTSQNGTIPTPHSRARSPFHDMLPHLHIIYNDVIVLSVLIKI